MCVCVNNLITLITRKWNGLVSKPATFSSQVSCPHYLIATPHHTHTVLQYPKTLSDTDNSMHGSTPCHTFNILTLTKVKKISWLSSSAKYAAKYLTINSYLCWENVEITFQKRTQNNSKPKT